MLVNFEEVAVKATKRWIDKDGKKRQKTRKFYQTLNPFNKSVDGSVKTRAQITAEIIKQRDDWLKKLND